MWQRPKSPPVPGVRASGAAPGGRTRRTRLLGAALVALLAAAAVLTSACGRPADPPKRAETPGYPRLALWWPDLGSIETSALARYDLVVLQDYDRDKAVALRHADSGVLILNSTNACELDYVPGDLKRNAGLAKVPARWLLTQVGSNLSAAVDARQTTFPVRAVTGPGGLVLFQAGDAVVVEDEIVKVTAVDAGARTIAVRRGTVKPATAHPAGARAAAAVSFYEDSLILDLSANCPPGRAFDSTTTETWATYAARKDAALVADPIWSGIMTDRAEINVGWLVGGRARSLDPDRSNRVVTDYSKLDAQWNEGVRAYERALRGQLGKRILLANWAMPNPDLLNGDIFEGFPQDSGRSFNGHWQETVFGPLEGHGGYLGVWAKAREPRTNLVATYRNDGRDRSDDGPVGPRDYRKMRFGLTTALLGDGLFAYEINAKDAEGIFHNSLYETWFDEYDGAGLGRGYLGAPASPPFRVAAPLTTPDVVGGGGFDNGADLATWRMSTEDGYAAAVALDGSFKHSGASAARVTVAQAGGVDYRAMLSRGGVAIEQGADYTISFWARADAPRRVAMWVQQGSGRTSAVDLGEVELSTEWREYQVSATAQANDPRGTLHLGFGQSAGTAWIDDLTLRRGSTSVWRRDFEKGIALVNASSTKQTVELGGSFRKLAGRQDRLTNDGSRVTRVEIPPLDGLVLLRP